ncbi:MAG: ATP-binding protein [Bacteroidetes bacterium]|nr:ATP-binding protein [Bacteroidota bacterium]
MISRHLTSRILKRAADSKALILLGPRQSGKTTLLKEISTRFEGPILWWDGDEADTRSMLTDPTSTRLTSLIGSNKTLIIDEAQRIENIGLCIKLIIDKIPGVKVIASGSSAFELANKINEPLTGRKWEFNLFPVCFAEMVEYHGLQDELRLLEHRMLYGYYPEVLNQKGDEVEVLKQLASSYLYKDILTWQRIQKPDRLERLVQALAFQIGSEVSYNELSRMSGLDNETVERYIGLLEKSFIVFRLGSFSRNLPSELKKSRKIYFYDNGIRNAVIKQFNPLSLRSDTGALWENFLVSERQKVLEYQNINTNRFFWRTTAQQEIDYLEERDGNIYAFEMKWNKEAKAKVRFPLTFVDNYPNSFKEIITPKNFESFLGITD